MCHSYNHSLISGGGGGGNKNELKRTKKEEIATPLAVYASLLVIPSFQQGGGGGVTLGIPLEFGDSKPKECFVKVTIMSLALTCLHQHDTTVDSIRSPKQDQLL